jgi:hypothetical protein
VLDSPRVGRAFFDDVIRQNLDLGRLNRVGLIFDRQIRTRGKHPTPGRFRTRVITEGVTPSLHIDYKHSKVKQYHKLGIALRTETTINNTYDFDIGRGLHNLAVTGGSGARWWASSAVWVPTRGWLRPPLSRADRRSASGCLPSPAGTGGARGCCRRTLAAC